MTTWKDIKIATLQKCFSAKGVEEIPNDTATQDYVDAMPNAANEGLQRLATVGKYIKKYVDIIHAPVDNKATIVNTMVKSETSWRCDDNIHSICFEYLGTGTLEILVDGSTFVYEQLEALNNFATFKHGYTFGSNDVEIKISVEYPMMVRNFALYEETYRDDNAIPTYSEQIRYNMKELASDFYELSDNDIFYEPFDGSKPSYIKTSKYFTEGNTVLLLNRDMSGSFRVYYNAYPQRITYETPDETEIVLDDELLVILPLYMASQLYKEDDIGLATSYRNEFEVALTDMINKQKMKSPTSERFTSKWGWY